MISISAEKQGNQPACHSSWQQKQRNPGAERKSRVCLRRGRQWPIWLVTLAVFCGCSSPVPRNWPGFRGPGGSGVADGYSTPVAWNADSSAGKIHSVSWRTAVPGMGHSSPIVWGDRIYLATAVPVTGRNFLALNAGGSIEAAADTAVQQWCILCYSRLTGEEIFKTVAHTGVPRVSRHVKATFANTTLATDGARVVAFFGSEGLYCYDMDGDLLWQQDLGVINISKYGIGWGYASSPVIYDGNIILVCDDPDNPFLTIRRLSDGGEIRRISRKGVSDRSWSTPLIYEDESGPSIIVNGWPWIESYDLVTGRVRWKIHGGGDNPVPTPFAADGLIYITSAHGKLAPIYVVSPDAGGDITPADDSPEDSGIVWNSRREGSYMSTPVVYGNNLYLAGTNGMVSCFNARTGERRYRERLGGPVTSSLVAADGKIYCASENGTVYVIAAGPEFKLLAQNAMGEPLLATPAIYGDALYIRTTASLVAVR